MSPQGCGRVEPVVRCLVEVIRPTSSPVVASPGCRYWMGPSGPMCDGTGRQLRIPSRQGLRRELSSDVTPNTQFGSRSGKPRARSAGGTRPRSRHRPPLRHALMTCTSTRRGGVGRDTRSSQRTRLGRSGLSGDASQARRRLNSACAATSDTASWQESKPWPATCDRSKASSGLSAEALEEAVP